MSITRESPPVRRSLILDSGHWVLESGVRGCGHVVVVNTVAARYAGAMTTEETREEIQKIAANIGREFRAEKVILFGSWASGVPTRDSDVDLFVVARTANTRKTAQDIYGSLWGCTIPFDIVVSTPENAQRRLAMGDFFVRDILQRGRVLYERR